MANNKTLSNAKRAKKDEFYTQLVDIENELVHYKEHFRDKVVFCNCDDPYESNFFKYFAANFNHLGLKKLIATCYDPSPIAGRQLDIFSQGILSKNERKAFKIEIKEVVDTNNDGAINLADVEYLIKNDRNVLSLLEGNGDYKSKECEMLLDESDIVVTNPPFSQLNDYILFLYKHHKKFLIMCNHNVVHYTEIFPLIKNNELWLGYNSNKTVRFAMPDYYEKWDEIIDGVKYGKVPSIGWITNLDIKKRHEDLILYKTYNEIDYPKYENLNAIDVERVSEIPCDYYGMMGVPDTFLDQYNPMQFEVLGADGIPRYAEELHMGRIGEDWMSRYRKNGGTGHYTANMKSLVITRDGVPQKPYSRILIRRKQSSAQISEISGSQNNPADDADTRRLTPKDLPMAAEPDVEYNSK